jgi:hypothetical protein
MERFFWAVTSKPVPSMRDEWTDRRSKLWTIGLPFPTALQGLDLYPDLQAVVFQVGVSF